MKTPLSIIITAVVLCFAQDTPEKLAVYVYGASDAGISKSLSSKLLIAITQSGKYVEIADPGSFQDEFAKGGKNDMTQISQVAKKHGADYVCVVSMIEAFGAYSISARLIKIAGVQTVKTASADRALTSLDDLTAVSNELAKQLIQPSSLQPPVQPEVAVPTQQYYAPPQPLAAQPAAPTQQYYAPPQPLAAQPATVAATVVQQGSLQPSPAMAAPEYAQKQCAKTFNINEIISKLKGFPNQLKDCSSKLAKEMALASMPFGNKSAPVEPKSYMKQCSVDGIRRELPQGFPEADKLVGSVDNFVQKIMNLASSANGQLDPSKLMSTVSNMNIDGLLSEVKGMLANGECMVDEVYTPAAQVFDYRSAENESSSLETKNDKSIISFGIRTGINSSWVNAGKVGYYGSKVGWQLGIALDIAVSELFHIQPSLMYVLKGTSNFYTLDQPHSDIAANYIEIPVPISLKLSMFRLNTGPYLGVCLGSGNTKVFGPDFGLTAGTGIDIDMFYVGMFYNYGLIDMSSINGFQFYNRTIGINAGINL